MANFYCGDNPQALQNQIKAELNLNDLQFYQIYSVGSFPTIFLTFLAGYFVDWLGIQKVNAIFWTVQVIGQFLSGISISLRNFDLLLVGQAALSIGGNCSNLVYVYWITKLFTGYHLAFIQTFSFSFGKVGNLLNSWITPRIYDNSQSVALPFYVGGGLLFLSWLIALGLNYCDTLWEKARRLTSADLNSTRPDSENYEPINADSLTPDDSQPRRWSITRISPICWCLIVISSISYTIYFTFTDIGSDFLQEYYSVPYEDSNHYLSIIYFSAIFGFPAIGCVIDWTGQRTKWVFISLFAGMLFCVLSLIGRRSTSDLRPLFSLIPFSTFYCTLAANVWTIIPLATEKDLMGLALGIYSCLKALGMTLLPLLCGYVKEANYFDGYGGVLLVFLGIYLITMIIWFFLNCLVRRDRHPVIEMTSEQLRERMQNNMV
jgi:nitrate/nitrite transporter NarK